jgi:hypothetical protein
MSTIESEVLERITVPQGSIPQTSLKIPMPAGAKPPRPAPSDIRPIPVTDQAAP